MGKVIIYNKTMRLSLSEAANSSIMLSVFKFLVTSSSIDKIARLESLSPFIPVLSLVSTVYREIFTALSFREIKIREKYFCE